VSSFEHFLWIAGIFLLTVFVIAINIKAGW
jgi:hypothetical protein